MKINLLVFFLSIIILISSCKKEDSPQLSPAFDFNDVYGSYSNPINEIIEDSNGNIWFGGSSILRFDGDTLINISADLNLELLQIISAYADDDNTIWFGDANSKIIRLNASTLEFTIHDSSEENDFDFNYPNDINKDSQGNYWFVSKYPPNLIRFDGANSSTIQYEGETSLSTVDIFEDQNEDLWFASTSNAVYQYTNSILVKTNLGVPAFTTIQFNNDILVGSLDGVKKIVGNDVEDLLPELSGFHIKKMIVDNSNKLWMANSYINESEIKPGVLVFDGNSIEKIDSLYGRSLSYSKTIFEDSQNRIWIAGSGLFLIEN